MSLRTITVVVLRIYTIIMVVQGLISLATVLPMYCSIDADTTLRWAFLYPVLLLLVGVILWCATLPLARLVSKGHDAPINAVSLTKVDLYNFAFVPIGVYIVLIHITPTVDNGIKFFQYDFNEAPGSAEKGHYLGPFGAELLALMLGFASALGAPKWTRLLLNRETARNLPD